MGAPGSGSTPDDILMAEWKEARSQIDSLDTLLSGLRKNGFAFITALLAADSVLGQATGQASIVLTSEVKLGVMITTLVLIIALYATDRFYLIIQKAFAESAIKIERGWITAKGLQQPGPSMVAGIAYKQRHAWAFVDLLYVLFGAADLALGYFILQPDTMQLFRWLAAGGASAVVFGLFMIWLSHGSWNRLAKMELAEMMA
ncbi:MAG: hypothetical protein KGI38_05885 [Thaumarchaeota archaeon]|nr:hypothetical protein [Nitrososphaerota archaeon]